MLIFRLSLRLCLCLVAIALLGCGGSPTALDGFDGDFIDAVDDRAPPPPLLACRSNADCSSGYTCHTGFAGGLCLPPACSSTRTCPRTHACVNGACLPRCTTGGGECEPIRALCLAGDSSDPAVRVCAPACYSTPPEGAPGCAAGTTCDAYRGVCTASPMTMGSENGEACRAATSCRSGRCLGETSDRPAPGTPTGFVNGYCFSLGRQLSATEYNSRIGGELPRSNCPAGSVVLPEREAHEGDPTICWRECDDTRPCRDGYRCEHLEVTDMMGRPMRAFRNGACLPVDCSRPGESCPADFYCQSHASDASQPYGTCARRASGTDGGATDAAGTPDAAGAPDGTGTDAAVGMDAGAGPG